MIRIEQARRFVSLRGPVLALFGAFASPVRLFGDSHPFPRPCTTPPSITHLSAFCNPSTCSSVPFGKRRRDGRLRLSDFVLAFFVIFAFPDRLFAGPDPFFRPCITPFSTTHFGVFHSLSICFSGFFFFFLVNNAETAICAYSIL